MNLAQLLVLVSGLLAIVAVLANAFDRIVLEPKRELSREVLRIDSVENLAVFSCSTLWRSIRVSPETYERIRADCAELADEPWKREPWTNNGHRVELDEELPFGRIVLARKDGTVLYAGEWPV